MFEIGTTLEAAETVQGLVKGRHYKVTEREDRVTSFGTFSTYLLEDRSGGQVQVNNAPLLLREVA